MKTSADPKIIKYGVSSAPLNELLEHHRRELFLTEKQLAILLALAEGLSPWATAKKLGIGSIQSQLGNILRKYEKMNASRPLPARRSRNV